MRTLSAALLIAFFIYAPSAFSRPTFTGYSGAPGTDGTCAFSCHGSGDGSIEITGFPTQYVPNQQYQITISHNGGSTIVQFNGSCRIGNGSSNAGVLSAGTSTATYNVINETNGIHFSSSNHNQGTFNWTAPNPGTGDVKLYVAGLQTNMDGLNTEIVLTATEQLTSVDENESLPIFFRDFANYPNPFNSGTVIEFYYDQDFPSVVSLGIYDLTGHQIRSHLIYCYSRGPYQYRWDSKTDSGADSPSGVYFCRLERNRDANTIRMIMLK